MRREEDEQIVILLIACSVRWRRLLRTLAKVTIYTGSYLCQSSRTTRGEPTSFIKIHEVKKITKIGQAERKKKTLGQQGSIVIQHMGLARVRSTQ